MNILETVMTIVIPLLGIVGYVKYQKGSADRARRKLHILEQEKETKELQDEIKAGIIRSRKSKKGYEDAKKYFKSKYNTTPNGDSLN